jgi:hypothetical protein
MGLIGSFHIEVVGLIGIFHIGRLPRRDTSPVHDK